MATETVDLGISDADMFRSAMADEPPAEPQAEPKVDANGRAHDERGRFAPKEADAAPIQQQEQKPEPVVEQPPAKEEHNVPSWRLREQREEFEARSRDMERRYQAQLADMQRQWQQQNQPKPEPVDFFQDPDAAVNQRLAPVQTHLEQLTHKLVLRASKAEAMAEHGAAAVKEMEQAVGKAMQDGHPDMPALSFQMRQSDDPVGVAMNWYRQHKLHLETGGDLTAYRTKLQDQLLKDPEFQKKAMEAWRVQASQPGQQPAVQMPPSLNKATGSAGNEQSEGGDLSNESLWAAARPTRGRK